MVFTTFLFSLVRKYCVIWLYVADFSNENLWGYLKIKGLSRETEALKLIGGGEMHSELSIPINYFFSSLIKVCYLP